MMSKTILLSLAAVLAIACGCSDNEPFDSNGAQNSNGANVPPGSCAATGSVCYNEGGVCGTNTCHCGYWVPSCSDQSKATCPSGQQPPATCVPSMACATNGNTCTGASGTLTCTCGMWATPAMQSKMDCTDHSGQGGSGGNPGNGGNGGSPSVGGSGGSPNVGGNGGSPNVGGSGGSPNASTGYHTFHISILSSAQHIYCQGAQTEVSYNDDTQVKFLENWHSFGCDSFDGSYDCDVMVQDQAALRYQCYLESPEAAPGDNVRYTCAFPSQLFPGESFSVDRDGKEVSPIKTAPNLAPESDPQSSLNCVTPAN